MLRQLCQTGLLCVGLLGLVACGGSDRDEPFNPGVTSSNNSSAPAPGASLDTTLLLDDTDPFLPFGEHKQIIVMRTRDEFYRYWDAYSDKSFDDGVVDFDVGQVVLVDDGDDNPCNQSINLRSFAGNDFTSNTALITLTYRDLDMSSSSRSLSSTSDPYHSSSESSSSSSEYAIDCTNKNPVVGYKRQYRFYFVKSRKTLMFRENVGSQN